MAEALSRRELSLLAQIELDLRTDDADLDRRLTTMRWDVPPPQPPPSAGHGVGPAVRALGALFRGVLGSAASTATTAVLSTCVSVWGLALTCLARLVACWARLRTLDDREPADAGS
ncbi:MULTISPECIES: DUF3040 domain-containing protein [unclassified Streptomyces]|uniref:DUF3040 domain-containing protein n=1 Tax=unclassified Streptomyces TaxID=2593676 RepID=UPI000372BA8C|nr:MULTISPECIES: DUF3040 domain-containing protein [unclassified Streptomyces]MYT29135.1 DUF3040 domain-containing protein [Streptomyces sp. SID8354]